MHAEHELSDLFLKSLLVRSMRIQADLVDQLFNSSERRLARILLLMAEFGQPGEPRPLIPKISQQSLAEMIGTTRSRAHGPEDVFYRALDLNFSCPIRLSHLQEGLSLVPGIAVCNVANFSNFRDYENGASANAITGSPSGLLNGF